MSEEEEIGLEPEAVESEEVQEIEESAPPEIEEASQEDAVADEGDPNGEGFQNRINKVTRQKHEQRERAEKAEHELEQLRSQQTKPQVGQAPTLEQFDYDEGQYQEAMIDYRVGLGFQTYEQQQKEQVAQQEQRKQEQVFNKKVESLGLDDYAEVTANLPRSLARNGAVAAIIEAGPEVAYHLGQHLDKADEIGELSPVQAAIRIGQLSAQLKVKPSKITTKAPAPVKTIGGSGGAPNKEAGDLSLAELKAQARARL